MWAATGSKEKGLNYFMPHLNILQLMNSRAAHLYITSVTSGHKNHPSLVVQMLSAELEAGTDAGLTSSDSRRAFKFSTNQAHWSWLRLKGVIQIQPYINRYKSQNEMQITAAVPLKNIEVAEGNANPLCANRVSHVLLLCPERAGVGAATL